MPPVTYDSDEAGTLELVLAMYANSAAWQTLLGVGTAALAKARIVEWDGGFDYTEGEAVVNCLGDSITAAAPLLAITSTEFPSEERALDSERRSGEFIARFYLAKTITDTAPEHGRRALNTAGAIRAQIRDQFGTAGRLMRGSVSLRGPFLAADLGQWSSAVIVEHLLSWRG